VQGSCAYEIKNYNLSKRTNENSMVNTIVKQAKQRVTNLPEGMQQKIVIDTRGQAVSQEQKERIRDKIFEKSNGIIKPNNVSFF